MRVSLLLTPALLRATKHRHAPSLGGARPVDGAPLPPALPVLALLLSHKEALVAEVVLVSCRLLRGGHLVTEARGRHLFAGRLDDHRRRLLEPRAAAAAAAADAQVEGGHDGRLTGGALLGAALERRGVGERVAERVERGQRRLGLRAAERVRRAHRTDAPHRTDAARAERPAEGGRLGHPAVAVGAHGVLLQLRAELAELLVRGHGRVRLRQRAAPVGVLVLEQRHDLLDLVLQAPFLVAEQPAHRLEHAIDPVGVQVARQALQRVGRRARRAARAGRVGPRGGAGRVRGRARAALDAGPHDVLVDFRVAVHAPAAPAAPTRGRPALVLGREVGEEEPDLLLQELPLGARAQQRLAGLGALALLVDHQVVLLAKVVEDVREGGHLLDQILVAIDDGVPNGPPHLLNLLGLEPAANLDPEALAPRVAPRRNRAVRTPRLLGGAQPVAHGGRWWSTGRCTRAL
mmetsp:Transcript_32065/g.74014  ORF Transcript_32065/g.74014 Transcript_32065/m.74014 type:complete len:462 (+) Transcript_32065:116-1501(+)